MKRVRTHTLLAALSAGCAAPVVGCATRAGADFPALSAQDLARHVQVLSADEFEGRAPSSPGEEKTLAYLTGQFEALGLEPGNHGSFLHEVPLVSITADPSCTLDVQGGLAPMGFTYGDQIMVWTKRVVEQVSLDRSDMVFVGYGIVAPEYGWDDYAGVDVRGKTVVMLVNDPGFATRDEKKFRGRAMTYYGRWTYKYEEAARHGAAGAFLVHETEPAAYPWEVVKGSWSGEQFDLVTADRNAGRCAVEGWLTLESARAIFQAAGLDYEQAKQDALTPDFEARPLGLTASLELRNTLRESTSHNVIALLPGTTRPQETILYMAHWDHLGKDPTVEGDGIFNGAVDNATGVGGLLEIARAYRSLAVPPERSIVFLAVTAEESGLLGSKYYTEKPVFPLADTVAAINMDALNVTGPTRDVKVIGFGSSELEEHLAAAARLQQRVLTPEPDPEKGYFYRSDHFNFAKKGVPALYAESGIDSVEHGKEWGQARADEYTAERYHKPSDEFDASWDLRGAVQDLQLLFRVGHQLSMSSEYPNWFPGNEFRALRDESRGVQSE